MSYKIEEIEGIGPAFAAKLSQASIKTTDDLLKSCCDSKGREQVAARTDINSAQLLKWANMADLMRVSGVGRQYAELLEATGVDTIKELRVRNPENLAAQIVEVNTQKKLAKSVPTPDMVHGWVAQAKTIEPKITY